MKHFKKARGRILALILSILVSLCSLPTSVSAAGTPAIQMSLDKVSYVSGEEVLLTLKLTEAVTIMALQVDIDMAKNTFVLDKLEILEPKLNGAWAGTKEGRLSLNWIADDLADTVLQAGDILRIRMHVKDSAAVGEKTFSFSYIEAGNGTLAYVTIDKGAGVTVTVSGAAKSQNVIDAENEIAKIDLDKITASAESLELITNAQLAFAKCSAAEKKLVSNVDLLIAAVEKYNRLKEEQAAADAENKIEQEIREYLETYYNQYASKTPETVELADKAGIMEAIKEYTKKSAYIRSRLKEEYDHLKELEAAVKVLEEKASAEAYADTFVPIFLENNKDILNMPVDSVTYEDENTFGQLQSKILDAIDFYNTILNDVGRERVSEEYQHLLDLLKKCEEIALENTPETPGTIKAYNEFRDKYMELLMKSPDEVTMEDLSAINSAISEIKNMKPAVSGRLINEYEYLMELLRVLNGTGSVPGWPDDNFSGGSTGTGDGNQVPGVVVPPTDNSGDSSGSDQNGAQGGARKTKVTVTVGDVFAIIVMVLICTAAVLFLLPNIVKAVLKKKQERRSNYGTEI